MTWLVQVQGGTTTEHPTEAAAEQAARNHDVVRWDAATGARFERVAVVWEMSDVDEPREMAG